MHKIYWYGEYVIIKTCVWIDNKMGGYKRRHIRTRLTLEEFEELYVDESCKLTIWIDRDAPSRPPTLEQIVSKYPGTRSLLLCSNFQEGYSSLTICRQLEKVTLKSHVQASIKGFEFLSSLRELSISQTGTGRYDEGDLGPGEPFCLDQLDGIPLERLCIVCPTRPVRGGGISLPQLKYLKLSQVPCFVEPFPGIWIPDSCQVVVNDRCLGEMGKMTTAAEKFLPGAFLGILPPS